MLRDGVLACCLFVCVTGFVFCWLVGWSVTSLLGVVDGIPNVATSQMKDEGHYRWVEEGASWPSVYSNQDAS